MGASARHGGTQKTGDKLERPRDRFLRTPAAFRQPHHFPRKEPPYRSGKCNPQVSEIKPHRSNDSQYHVCLFENILATFRIIYPTKKGPQSLMLLRPTVTDTPQAPTELQFNGRIWISSTLNVISPASLNTGMTSWQCAFDKSTKHLSRTVQMSSLMERGGGNRKYYTSVHDRRPKKAVGHKVARGCRPTQRRVERPLRDRV